MEDDDMLMDWPVVHFHIFQALLCIPLWKPHEKFHPKEIQTENDKSDKMSLLPLL